MATSGPTNPNLSPQLLLLQTLLLHTNNDSAIVNFSLSKSENKPKNEMHLRQQALYKNSHNPKKPKPTNYAKSDTPINRLGRSGRK